MGQQVEGGLQPFECDLVVAGVLLDEPFGFGDLGGDCRLALLEVGDRDGFGEVGVDELLLGGVELLEPGLLVGSV